MMKSQKNGVTDGVRTRDIQNHNLELYQLSYGHRKETGIVPSEGNSPFVHKANPTLAMDGPKAKKKDVGEGLPIRSSLQTVRRRIQCLPAKLLRSARNDIDYIQKLRLQMHAF